MSAAPHTPEVPTIIATTVTEHTATEHTATEHTATEHTATEHPPTRFPSAVYADRLTRAASVTADAGLDALIVTPGADLRFLLGSTAQSFERLTALVIPADGSQATIVVPRLELAGLSESAVADTGVEVRVWVDGDAPHAIVAELVGRGARTAITDTMPALHLVPIADSLNTAPVLATPILRRLRMVKDAAEVAALRTAGAAIDRVHARMGEFLRVGRTEEAIAADITAAIVEEGHTGAEFVIVGSGPHGADPHHEVSDRIVAEGDVVVVDIGGPVHPGYFSDSTRTYVLGEPAKDVAAAVNVLECAQRAAVDAVRPGVTAEQVDAAARDVLADANLAEYFVHRTGHGIGLSVHEEPYIVAGNDLPLTEGMAFSIEPGIYFPGQWGARIEDIVVVTAHGCESLNTRPHELTVLPTD